MIVMTEIAMAITSAVPGAQPVDHATRTAILDAARRPVVAELGKPVIFKVQLLKMQDGWAFLHADMEDRDGAPVDYRGTPKAAAAEQGFVSRKYAALLREADGGWKTVAHAVGPTDVAWADWAERYGAPAAIFQGD